MNTSDGKAPEPQSVRDEVARIGDRIRLARAEHNLSQTEVARRAGTTPTRVWKLERADAAVRIDTLVRIAAVVNLRVTLEPIAA